MKKLVENMSSNLNNLFDFLNTNRKYNYLIQERNYQNIFCGKTNDKEGLIALLYQVSSTQTQPKIDLLAQFFSKLHEEENSFNSFQSFFASSLKTPLPIMLTSHETFIYERDLINEYRLGVT